VFTACQVEGLNINFPLKIPPDVWGKRTILLQSKIFPVHSNKSSFTIFTSFAEFGLPITIPCFNLRYSSIFQSPVTNRAARKPYVLEKREPNFIYKIFTIFGGWVKNWALRGLINFCCLVSTVSAIKKMVPNFDPTNRHARKHPGASVAWWPSTPV
jgi:hypothetical protein